MQAAKPRILTIDGGSSSIRFAPHRVGEGLEVLGIELNRSRHAKNAALVWPDGGRFRMWVIRTDEALMIASPVTRVHDLGAIRDS
jgi:acetate kinase